MKTHMMGVGMALLGMVLMPVSGVAGPSGAAAQKRAGRGPAEDAGYSRVNRGEAVGVEAGFMMSQTMSRQVAAEDLAALIPQEVGFAEESSPELEKLAEAVAGGAGEVETPRVSEVKVVVEEEAAGLMEEGTGIFCFRATDGEFELEELKADGGFEEDRESVVGREMGLMKRIRSL
jgi:hypothetical protein